MTEASRTHESGERLVAMANDIGNYFRPQSREEAIAGIANHIKRYWTARMRQKLNAYLAQGANDLDELPRAAVDRLNAETQRIAGEKDYVKLIQGMGTDVARSSPEAFGAFVRDDVARWSKVIERSSIPRIE